MRVFGLIGLVLALLVVGVLVKKQAGSLAPPASSTAPSATGGAAPSTAAQGRQLQQGIQKSLDAALQQSRPMPADNP